MTRNGDCVPSFALPASLYRRAPSHLTPTSVQPSDAVAQHTMAMNTMPRAFAPAAMERSGSWRDLVIGPALQCLEAASLGMPFEVWKTRMGRFRNEGSIEALLNVYKAGGGGLKGVGAFWAGVDAKV